MTNTHLVVLLAVTVAGALLAWPKQPTSRIRERAAAVMVYAPIVVLIAWAAAT